MDGGWTRAAEQDARTSHWTGPVRRAVEYLELLAREAAAVEFEGPLVARAGRRRAAPSELAELEQAKLVALRGPRRCWSAAAAGRRSCPALFDTASDLAGLRDVDAVLHAIVHRARKLLGADVAYLTLNDDAARRHLHAGHRRLDLGPLPARCGCRWAPGSAAWSRRPARPYVTANYADDERFRHTGEIDDGRTRGGAGRDPRRAAAAGLRASIGVLFAANRSARPFAREEVALLGSLAAHAAVAIDTARLLDETRAALAELSAANATIRAHSASVERAAAAHDRMTALVLRGGGVEDVAAGGHRGARRRAAGARRRRAASWPGSARSASRSRPALAEARRGRARRPAARRGGGRSWYAAVVAGTRGPGRAGAAPGARAGRRRPADPRAGGPRHRAAAALPPHGRRGRGPGPRRAARRPDRPAGARRRRAARPGPPARRRPRRAARRRGRAGRRQLRPPAGGRRGRRTYAGDARRAGRGARRRGSC